MNRKKLETVGELKLYLNEVSDDTLLFNISNKQGKKEICHLIASKATVSLLDGPEESIMFDQILDITE